MPVSLVLPFPPSMNHYWRYDPATGRVLLSQQGRAYRKDAGWHILAQKPHQLSTTPWPLAGRLSVTLILQRSDKRAYDIDNYCKGVLDLLQHCHVIVNDQQIDVLQIRRGDVRLADGLVIVEITELCPKP